MYYGLIRELGQLSASVVLYSRSRWPITDLLSPYFGIGWLIFKYNWDLVWEGITFTQCYWTCVSMSRIRLCRVCILGGKRFMFFIQSIDWQSSNLVKTLQPFCLFIYLQVDLREIVFTYSLVLTVFVRIIIAENCAVQNFMKLFALAWLLLRFNVGW